QSTQARPTRITNDLISSRPIYDPHHSPFIIEHDIARNPMWKRTWRYAYDHLLLTHARFVQLNEWRLVRKIGISQHNETCSTAHLRGQTGKPALRTERSDLTHAAYGDAG